MASSSFLFGHLSLADSIAANDLRTFALTLKAGDKISVPKKANWIISAGDLQNPPKLSNLIILNNTIDPRIRIVLRYPEILTMDASVSGILRVGAVIASDSPLHGSYVDVWLGNDHKVGFTVECRKSTEEFGPYTKDCNFAEFVETLNQHGASLQK